MDEETIYRRVYMVCIVTLTMVALLTLWIILSNASNEDAPAKSVQRARVVPIERKANEQNEQTS